MRGINYFEYPCNRIEYALERGWEKDIVFMVAGGIGDVICAEPSIRFSVENAPENITVSISTKYPEIFRHLPLHKVHNKIDFTPEGNLIATYPNSQLLNQMISPNLINCVDYPSLASLRLQLPIEYKTPQIQTISDGTYDYLKEDKYILIHMGKSWPSRTIPAWWYQQVVSLVLDYKYIPVLFGQNCVQVKEFPDLIDLRDKLSFENFLHIIKNCSKLITNDSSPLHIAASGEGRIAFISSAKRGELLLHYRHGELGWNMKDFCRKDITMQYEYWPIHLRTVKINELPKGIMWDHLLPKPENLLDWLINEKI